MDMRYWNASSSILGFPSRKDSTMRTLCSSCLLQHTLAVTPGIKRLFPILFNSRYVSARRYRVGVWLCLQCAWCTAHRCAKSTGFKIHHLFTVTALAVETAASLHMQASGWTFAGFLLEKHLEGWLCWGVAGSSQVAGGGIAIAIVTWETERYGNVRAAVFSHIS